MSPTPTGRLFGDDLVLTRTFRAPIGDVWASLTDPERTARWFGPWQGDAAPGRTINIQMVYEEGKPWMEMTIDACEPPHRLAVARGDQCVQIVLPARSDLADALGTGQVLGEPEFGAAGSLDQHHLQVPAAVLVRGGER